MEDTMMKTYEFSSEENDASLEDGFKYKFERICKACGRPFRTIAANQTICNRQHYHPCPVCGKITAVKGRNFDQWRNNCCSNECKHELTIRNMTPRTCVICGESFLATSGVSKICPKEHHVTCEICGKDFVITRKDRFTTTCSRECSKEKTRRFYQLKYHTDHPMQNPEVQKHHQEAMKEKYGVTHALKLEKFMHQQQETVVQTNTEKYGVPYACMLPQCSESQGKIISEINYESKKFLESLGLQCSLEKRLDNYSFDICIEEYKILIEIDPTYTHSTIPTHWGTSREYDYHLKKSKTAEHNGYRCIHLFDWDDKYKILSMIKPRIRVHARQCQIYKLNTDIAKEFIEQNHIQGNCRGQKLFLGLVKDNELYEVMSFGFPRYDKHHDVELLRLCTKSGFSVPGGASKLFKFATECYGLNNIISYCDISKFNGSVYESIGMSLLRTTPPQEIWSKGTEHVTANLLRQRGYDQLFKTNYGKGTDNEKLMLEHGWLPIYDCGMKVFSYK